MFVGEEGEDVEDDGPQANEEAQGEEGGAPVGDVLAAKEELPVTTVGRGEPVVLDDDGDEEPGDELAVHEGDVETRDGLGLLAVVVGQAKEEDNADGPHDDGDRDADDECNRDGGVGDIAGDGGLVVANEGTPVPQHQGVDLCDTSDNDGANDP